MRSHPILCSIVAVFAVVFTSGHQRVCEEDSVLRDMRDIQRMLDIFRKEHGRYPLSLDEHVALYPKSELPRTDQWDQPYQYRREGIGYVLYSFGPDRSPKTLDDVYPGWDTVLCTVVPWKDPDIDDIAVPTPCDTADGDVHQLEYLLELFHETNHRYPTILHELNNHMVYQRRYFAESMFVDPWGEPYAYRRLSFGYELFSMGADRLANTEDDLVGGQRNVCSFPPYDSKISDHDALIARSNGWPAYDPCVPVLDRLDELATEIEGFRETNGRYPTVLAELYQRANTARIRTLIDPWGTAFSYRRSKSKYVLFSNGPDRLPGTSDDLPRGSAFDRCKPPPYLESR